MPKPTPLHFTDPSRVTPPAHLVEEHQVVHLLLQLALGPLLQASTRAAAAAIPLSRRSAGWLLARDGAGGGRAAAGGAHLLLALAGVGGGKRLCLLRLLLLGGLQAGAGGGGAGRSGSGDAAWAWGPNARAPQLRRPAARAGCAGAAALSLEPPRPPGSMAGRIGAPCGPDKHPGRTILARPPQRKGPGQGRGPQLGALAGAGVARKQGASLKAWRPAHLPPFQVEVLWSPQVRRPTCMRALPTGACGRRMKRGRRLAQRRVGDGPAAIGAAAAGAGGSPQACAAARLPSATAYRRSAALPLFTARLRRRT